MNCITCNGETRVIDSRSNDGSVRRRRQCTACGGRFSTNEVLIMRGGRAVSAPAPVTTAKPKPKPKPKPVSSLNKNAQARRRIEEIRDVEDHDDFSPMEVLRGY